MKRPLLFICQLLATFEVFSQVEKLSELETPTAPAFVLLDQAPSSIAKPTDPKALSLSLINLGQGGAMEFTPYWFKTRASLTFSEYMNNQTPIIQTLAFSVATVKSQSGTTVGIGARSQIFRTYSKTKQTEIGKIKANLQSLLSTLPLNLSSIEKERDNLQEIKAKPTFNIEIAGAYLAHSVGSSYDNLNSLKSGAWLNARWSPSSFPLDLVALGRFSWTKGKDAGISDSTLFDYGLSLSLQKKSYDLALEYVLRNDTENSLNYDRLAFVGNFAITEGVTAVASFGKNFNDLSDIFSVFGVKLSLSRQRMDLSK